MEKKIQNSLIALLEAEAEARNIIEKAESEARELRDQTRKEALKVVEDIKNQEGQEIQKTLNEVRSQNEQIRGEILDRARKEAQHWDELFQQNHDRAINFIIDQIISNKPQ
jgi:vacuolar-type H+-ATPase subunit H